MCSRYSISLEPETITRMVTEAYPGIRFAQWINKDKFIPRYNVGPRSHVPVMHRISCNRDEASGSAGRYVVRAMQWDLVLDASPRTRIDKKACFINIRADRLMGSIGRRNNINWRRRCVVVCQGYYAWRDDGKDKLPYFIKHKDDKLMLMAGVYDVATRKGHINPHYSFAIVTTEATKELAAFNDRHPVILWTTEQVHAWLDTPLPFWTEELTDLVEPYCDDTFPLTWYRVPKGVGKAGTEDPAFIEPITQWKGSIDAMFAKQVMKARIHAQVKEEHTSKYFRTEVLAQDISVSPSSKDRNETIKRVLDKPTSKANTVKKHRRLAHVGEPEDVKIIKFPSPTLRSQIHKQSKKRAFRKKTKALLDASGCRKITDFFISISKSSLTSIDKHK